MDLVWAVQLEVWSRQLVRSLGTVTKISKQPIVEVRGLPLKVRMGRDLPVPEVRVPV